MLSAHRWMVGTAMAASLLAGMLAGCPGRPEPEAPIAPDAGMPAEVTPPVDEGAPSAGAASKLGDIIALMPASFEATITITPAEGEPQTTTVALQMADGKPLRMKTEAPEQQGTMVVDYQQKKMYMWDEARGQGMSVPLSDAQANLPESAYADVDPEIKISGSEVVNGVDCWVVETTDDQGRTVTTWYAKDNGLVQKVEAENVTMTYEYSRVGDVPDSEFEVPADITFREMPAMPALPSGG